MTLDLRNNFESGQSNGTGITTGNSGGGAGNAWDTVTASGSGASAVYTTAFLEGSLSGDFAVGTTSTAARVSWSTALGGTFSRLQGGFGVKPDSLPASQVAICRFTATGTQACRFTIDSTGTISLRDKNSANSVTSTGTMTTSDKWWVTFDITFGATASGTFYIYYSHASTTPDETIPFSGKDFLSTAINGVDFGICANTTSVSVVMDSIRITDQGVPTGPRISGTLSAPLGGLSASLAGSIVINGSLSTSLGGLDAALTGRAIVLGTLSGPLGGLDGLLVGQAISGGVVNGVLTATLGGLDGQLVGSIVGLVNGVLSADLGGLNASLVGVVTKKGILSAALGSLAATMLIPSSTFFFTPPQRTDVIVMEGSLRVTFPVSSTVWKDQNGVWQYEWTPSAEKLAVAQQLLSVGGRPQFVSEEIAEELAAAGIGTITQMFG